LFSWSLGFQYGARGEGRRVRAARDGEGGVGGGVGATRTELGGGVGAEVVRTIRRFWRREGVVEGVGVGEGRDDVPHAGSSNSASSVAAGSSFFGNGTAVTVTLTLLGASGVGERGTRMGAYDWRARFASDGNDLVSDDDGDER
jgi:hypothetical protein